MQRDKNHENDESICAKPSLENYGKVSTLLQRRF